MKGMCIGRACLWGAQIQLRRPICKFASWDLVEPGQGWWSISIIEGCYCFPSLPEQRRAGKRYEFVLYTSSARNWPL